MQARINVGIAFVDAAADGGNDLVDDPHQVLFVLESHIRERQLTVAFHENLLGAVYENVVYGVVLQQGFKRAETFDFIKEFFVKRVSVISVEHDVFASEHLIGDGVDFGAQITFCCSVERGQIEAVEKLAVKLKFELANALAALGFFINGCGLCRRA